VQKHALTVVALLVSKPGRTVFGRAKLRLEDPFAVLRAVDSLDAALCILLFLESDVDSKGLVVTILSLPIANRNLLDVAILPEKLRLSEGLEQLVLSYGRSQAGDVDEVFLDDANADEVLARVFLGIAILYLFLAL